MSVSVGGLIRPEKQETYITMEKQTEIAKGRPAVEFTIDGETFLSEERELVAGDILQLAGKDPATHYLVEVRGQRERHEYKDSSKIVKVHPGSKFVTIFTGSTPVS